MIKALQIPYDNNFSKKCEYSSLAGFEHIAVSFYGMFGKNEYEWKKPTEDIEIRIKCTHLHNNFNKDDKHNTIDSGTISWEKVRVLLKILDITASSPLKQASGTKALTFLKAMQGTTTAPLNGLKQCINKETNYDLSIEKWKLFK